MNNSTPLDHSMDRMGTSKLLMGLAFGLLILVTLAGNVLVCVAVCINKKLRKKENLYFVSLAFADLLLSILVMPFGAVNEIASEWYFGNYCKYWMCLDICFVTASILHLAAISFDRYTHIHNPLRYEERMTVTKITAAILGVWATSVAVAFLPLAFDTYFHRALVAQITRRIDYNINSSTNHLISGSSLDSNSRKIRTDHPDHYVIRYQCEFNLDPLYAVVSSLTSFYIPCVLMISAYGKLYRYAQRHSRAIRKQQEEVRIPLLVKKTTGNCAAVRNDAQNGTMEVHERPKPAGKPLRMDGDHKARVTLGVITGLFLASWLPFFVANIVRSWCGDDLQWFCPPDWLFITLTWMGYANSAQNPIIYSIFNRDFRAAFRRILLCGRRDNVNKLGVVNQKFINNQCHRRSVSSMVKSERRKSEAARLARRKSSSIILDIRNSRSASIVARLAADNGCAYTSNKIVHHAMDIQNTLASHSSLSVSNFKDENSISECCIDKAVWIQRDDPSIRRKSFGGYLRSWRTSLT